MLALAMKVNMYEANEDYPSPQIMALCVETPCMNAGGCQCKQRNVLSLFSEHK
jgi:hypothetical protein